MADMTALETNSNRAPRTMAGQGARGEHHEPPSPPVQVLAFNDRRVSLIKRIAVKQARHEGCADERAALKLFTTKELRAHTKWERQQRRLAS
jgi:hypothetical protein